MTIDELLTHLATLRSRQELYERYVRGEHVDFGWELDWKDCTPGALYECAVALLLSHIDDDRVYEAFNALKPETRVYG